MKSLWDFLKLDFGSLLKISSVANTKLWFLQILFSEIILADERHFCDYLIVNEIARSKKQMLGYKQTTLWSHVFDFPVLGLITTPHYFGV